jgi:calcineurin-like phosphoesterase family protein
MKTNTYFASDHHFGHDNILKFTKRPYSSVEEMTEDYIKKHNSKVRPHDYVYFGGDIFWSTLKDHQKAEILSRMNGIKILIIGNHDKMKPSKARRLGFHWASYGEKIKFGNRYFFISHYPPRRGWIRILWNRFRQKGFDFKYLFSRLKHVTKFPIYDKDMIFLFGHTHQEEVVKPEFPGQYHIGLDSSNGYPTEISEIINKLNEMGW